MFNAGTDDSFEITIDLIRKNIRNIHLRVLPPLGNIRVSAPNRMNVETIRIFVMSKMDWIRKQQKKIREQNCELSLHYLDHESHPVWGEYYPLKVIEVNQPPIVKLENDTLILQHRPGADKDKRRSIVEAWYRDEIKKTAPLLIRKWEAIMDVQIKKFSVRKMKSLWGSCNPALRHIRLNSELAKRAPQFLEYLVVHEMVHLLEPSHNSRFKSLMDQFFPQWKVCRKELKQSPIHIR